MPPEPPERNSLSESASRGYTFTTQSSVTYDNKFGKHTVGAMFLAETRENKSNALSATGEPTFIVESPTCRNTG